MQALVQGIKSGLRLFIKSPGLVLAILISVGIGTSANIAVFSWIQALLLRPLPGVAQAERLVTLETTAGGQYIDTSYPDYKNYRDLSRSLSGVIVFKDRKVAMGEGQQAQWVWSEMVSGNFFEVLGVKPRLGRFFSPDEQKEIPGGVPVAVISSRLWRRSFHSDPSIVGQTVKFNGFPFTITGVAADDFRGSIVGCDFDVWLPVMMLKELSGENWLTVRPARPLHAMARLAPGVSIEKANVEISNIAKQLEQSEWKDNKGVSAVLLPIWKAPYGAQSLLRTLLTILMGVAVIVLLIVCSNIANLLLMKAVGREKEISIRLALGATRTTVVSQLFGESLVLSIAGSIGGFFLAYVIKDSLKLMLPVTDKPFAIDSRIDGTVLFFSLLLAVLAAILFGMVPALQATRLNVSESLNRGGRGSSFGNARLRNVFVVSSVAFGLVAAIGAGLFLKSFENARRTDIGFDPDSVLLVAVNLSQDQLSKDQGKVFYQRVTQQMQALPGVQSVTYAEDVPLGFGGGSWDQISVDGYQPQRGESMKVYRNIVSPGYFQTMKIPLLAGRDFTEQDDGSHGDVIIVNQAFAKRYLGTSIPVGRIVKIWGEPVTVIGVARNSKYRFLQEDPQPYMYYSFAEAYRRSAVLHIRTAGDPSRLLPEVNRGIKQIDPNISIVLALSLKDYVGASFFTQKLAAVLLTILGSVALVLAVIGVYGVTSYSVTQRQREFGIRMALGAQKGVITRLVLRQGLLLAVAGIVLGLAATLALSRVASRLLFGVSATDIGIFLAASILLTSAVLAASYFPTRKAMAVDPLIALRCE